MADADRVRWEKKYAAGAHREREPEALVVDAAGRAPPGRALDVAAGRGRHAIFLARAGFAVDAIDISPSGLADARIRAGDLPIRWIEADLDEAELEESAYALVVCVDFTDAALIPRLIAALAPGGLFAYVARPNALCSYGPAPGQAAGWFSGLETFETLVQRESKERVELLGKRR